MGMNYYAKSTDVEERTLHIGKASAGCVFTFNVHHLSIFKPSNPRQWFRLLARREWRIVDEYGADWHPFDFWEKVFESKKPENKTFDRKLVDGFPIMEGTWS